MFTLQIDIVGATGKEFNSIFNKHVKEFQTASVSHIKNRYKRDLKRGRLGLGVISPLTTKLRRIKAFQNNVYHIYRPKYIYSSLYRFLREPSDYENRILFEFPYDRDPRFAKYRSIDAMLKGYKINVSPKMRRYYAYLGFPLKKTTKQFIIPPYPILERLQRINILYIFKKHLKEEMDACMEYIHKIKFEQKWDKVNDNSKLLLEE